MKSTAWLSALLVGCVLFLAALPSLVSGAETGARDQASIVASEVSALSHMLAVRPQTALDFSQVSGEYCFDVNLGDGGHMTHYAIDPSKTQEDVIDFVNAEPLIKAGGKVDSLPRFP